MGTTNSEDPDKVQHYAAWVFTIWQITRLGVSSIPERIWERSGSVEECLTGDQEASLRCGS